jgi:hypothetical protein
MKRADDCFEWDEVGARGDADVDENSTVKSGLVRVTPTAAN